MAEAKAVITMDRSISLGAPSGPLSEDVKASLQGSGVSKPVMSVVYGIGGRDLSVEDGKNIFGMANEGGSFGASSLMYGVKV